MQYASLRHPNASLFIPDGSQEPGCFSRTTHLGIGAHPDDLEIMALHGIAACYSSSSLWFSGITCTNGLGSPRTGLFSTLNDEQYRAVREMEQNEAAAIGAYSYMAQLAYDSPEVKAGSASFEDDLVDLLMLSKPTVVYTHNPADKHTTHIAVLKSVIRAIRRLPPDRRPFQLFGCEVWRGLDWVPDAQKVVLDVTGCEFLSQRLLEVYASQVAGGKRYDEAAEGRRRANATFLNAKHADKLEHVAFALDMSSLITEEDLNPEDLVLPLIDQLQQDILDNLK